MLKILKLFNSNVNCKEQNSSKNCINILYIQYFAHVMMLGGCYNTATVLNLTLNNAFNQSLVNAVFGDTFYGKLMCYWGIGHISISESLHEQ